MREFIIAVVLSLLAIHNVGAQPADEIVAGYIAAIGGRDKMKELKTLYLEGVTVLPDGNEIISKLYKVDGKLFRREVNFGMGSSTMILNNKEGWYTNPRSDNKFQKMPEAMYKSQLGELDIAGPLFNYAVKGHELVLAGKDSINGRVVHNLKMTLKSGKTVNYFIDAENYYLVRQSFKPGVEGMEGIRPRPGADPNVEIVIEYSDFRKTSEGYVFPFTVSSVAMGGSMIFEKIEPNKAIDPDVLRQPK